MWPMRLATQRQPQLHPSRRNHTCTRIRQRPPSRPDLTPVHRPQRWVFLCPFYFSLSSLFIFIRHESLPYFYGVDPTKYLLPINIYHCDVVRCPLHCLTIISLSHRVWWKTHELLAITVSRYFGKCFRPIFSWFYMTLNYALDTT